VASIKVIIFGAGGQGRRIYNELANKPQIEVVGFVDNNKEKQGGEIFGISILSPEHIAQMEYDKIYIASMYAEDIENQLFSMGIESFQIETFQPQSVQLRIEWLRAFSEILNARNIPGDVAEAGVFRGDFAKYINLFFPNRILHLFDTFEGFSDKDIACETFESAASTGNYSNTSIQIVKDKLPHPELARIYPGYFPESAIALKSDYSYCFVNLDMDLYLPTFRGLKFFWDKMSLGGVILVHDFFGEEYPNVRKAVFDFEAELGHAISILPIGDGLSVAITK